MAGNSPSNKNSADNPADQSLFDRMSSEVTPEVSPLLQFLMNNGRRMLIGLAVCVIAGAGYGVYNWQAKKQAEQAQNDLGQILVISDSAARLTKLNEFLAKAPAGIKTAVTLAIANTAAEAKNYDAAGAAWGELARDTKSTLYAAALIGKAENLAMAGKDKEALAALEGSALAEDSSANALINSLIVDLAEKAGDTAKAIAACEKLALGSGLQNPEEAEFWRQKAAFLRLKQEAKS